MYNEYLENLKTEYLYDEKDGMYIEIKKRKKCNLDNERERRLEKIAKKNGFAIEFSYIPLGERKIDDLGANEFMQRIHEGCVIQDLTLDDLTKRTKIPKATIQRYLSGKTEKIPLERFLELAKAVDREEDEALGVHDTLDGIEHYRTKAERLNAITMNLNYEFSTLTKQEKILSYIANSKILGEVEYGKILEYAQLLAMKKNEDIAMDKSKN